MSQWWLVGLLLNVEEFVKRVESYIVSVVVAMAFAWLLVGAARAMGVAP